MLWCYRCLSKAEGDQGGALCANRFLLLYQPSKTEACLDHSPPWPSRPPIVPRGSLNTCCTGNTMTHLSGTHHVHLISFKSPPPSLPPPQHSQCGQLRTASAKGSKLGAGHPQAGLPDLAASPRARGERGGILEAEQCAPWVAFK